MTRATKNKRTVTTRPRRAADFDQKLINLPVHVWEAIEAHAYNNWRTVTAEVRARLESTLEKSHGVIVGVERNRGK